MTLRQKDYEATMLFTDYVLTVCSEGFGKLMKKKGGDIVWSDTRGWWRVKWFAGYF